MNSIEKRVPVFIGNLKREDKCNRWSLTDLESDEELWKITPGTLIKVFENSDNTETGKEWKTTRIECNNEKYYSVDGYDLYNGRIIKVVLPDLNGSSSV